MSLRILILPLALFLTGCDRSGDSTPQPDPGTPPPVNPIDQSKNEPSGSKPPSGSKTPSVVSQLDHQWEAIELWEGDSKSPDDVVSSTMVEFKDGKFKYFVDGETNQTADYRIVEAKTDPGRLQLIFSADGTTQTINVVFTVSDDQLTFVHPLSSSAEDRWPGGVEKAADLVYAVFRRK